MTVKSGDWSVYILIGLLCVLTYPIHLFGYVERVFPDPRTQTLELQTLSSLSKCILLEQFFFSRFMFMGFHMYAELM